MERYIPDLAIDGVMKDHGDAVGIDTKQVPNISNEMAGVLVSGGYNLRTSLAAIARLLGWLAFQAEQHGMTPEDFTKAATQQTLNYSRAFSSYANRQ
jgi:hypothetical protein